MKKKLAIWTHGGIGTAAGSQGHPLVTQVTEKLAERFDVSVFSLSAVNDDFQAKNFKMFCVPRNVFPNALRWIYLVFLFISKKYKEKYEILFSFWGYPTGTFIVVLGKIFRLPSVVNILGAESANLPSIHYGHLRKFFPRRIVLWTCRNASELVAVSRYQLEILQRHGMKRAVAHVIPWGVDQAKFQPSHRSTEIPLKIIHVANLTPVKDQQTLLKAFFIIRQKLRAKLRIIGPDFMNGKIQALITEYDLGEDVEMTGFILNAELASHYRWADVFMLTSLSEGQNNAATEALACGLILAGTNVGILFDIGNEVGVVVDPGDYQRLAEKLVELHTDSDAWTSRQKAAITWSTKHDLTWTIDQLTHVIDAARA